MMLSVYKRSAPKWAPLLVVTFAMGLTACATTASSQTALRIDPVGPPVPVALAPTNAGTLVVYTDWIPVGGVDVDTHERQDYRILRTDGTLYRKVSNSTTPAPVSLPVGSYLVATTVAPYGMVRIPVRVEVDRTTTICLSGEWDAQFRRVPANAVVKLPDGRIVGWRLPPSAAASGDVTAR